MKREDCKLCQIMLKKYPDDPKTPQGLLRHGTCGLCGYDCTCTQCVKDGDELANALLEWIGYRK
jgi:hypothetical protein